MYIYHHHYVVLVARISLTLSRHFSQSFIASGRSSGQHPLSSHSCWMYVCAGRVAYIYILDKYWHNDKRRIKDAGRKTQEDFRKIFTSHFIARVRKGCSRFACERVLETEHKLHILTPLLWPSRCVFLVLLNAQPKVLGSTAGCWLSLLHLISIFSGPQFIRASKPIGLVWLSLPHLVSNSLEVCWQLLWHPTQLNAHTITHWIFEIECLIVIKRK